MGQRALPSIDGILSALEVVTNPDKYATYMKDLAAAYEQAKDAQGDADTKGKLDAFSVIIDSKQAALDKNTKVAQEALRAEKEALNAKREQHAQDVEAFLHQQDNAAQKHDEALRGIAQRYAEQDAYVKQCEVGFAQRNADYEQKNAVLVEREARLEVMLKKVAPVAAALGVTLE